MLSALSVTHLKKIYPTGVQALRDVSLDVEAGDFFGLLGPNGAGKTTLIGIAAGLVNKTEGQVTIAGVDFAADESRAKAYLGLVPQEMNFSIFEKVEDIVVNQAGYYGIAPRVARRNAEEFLKQLGLWEKRREYSRTLSGGMKRRLMIARALVHRPRVLILDEPTAGVDIELRRGMWDFLRDLNASGVTIILTTHYLEEAEQLCQNVAIINHGEIVEQGTVKDLLGKLDMETFLLDTDQAVTETQLKTLGALHIKMLDPVTLELNLEKNQSINTAIRALDQVGITVKSMRNKANRLEELFLRLTKKTL